MRIFVIRLNIRVIPEIDMPGHSAAFRKAIGKDIADARRHASVERSFG